jgi:lysophospholipase L1-like esterase
MEKQMSERSVLSRGDIMRIAYKMKQALSGAPLTIAFLGGSITCGGSADSRETGYVSLVSDWFTRKFPRSPITTVNAGIPGTGSLIGVHRVDSDVLVHEPDLVWVEFAANDSNPSLTENYDSMVRKILRSAALPGVTLLHMTNENGGGYQEIHKMTGLQYDLPMISFKNAVWPDLVSGHLKWSDIEADTVHPNNSGHRLIADFIIYQLEEIADFAAAHDVPAPSAAIRPPLNGDIYEHARIVHSNAIRPVSMGRWEIAVDTPMFKPGWRALGPGAPMVFDIECRNIGMIFNWQSNGKMGRVSVTVDGGEPIVADAYTPSSGVSRGTMFAKGLVSGTHRIVIDLCAESNPGSSGHEFDICALLVS